MLSNYNILISKLDEFIRKYYKNQLIKGGIYSLSTLLIFYILITIVEYFGHFGITVRTIIFYTYLSLNFAIIVFYFLIPLLKLYKIGKIISHKQAAAIIGKHFAEVGDKLLNTLQLKELNDSESANNILITASINQKIFQLKPIPFKMAIDLKKNRKYLKYTIAPVILIMLFLFTAPSIITAPTNRIINHNVFFEKEAPFHFIVVNNKFNVVQQEDFLLSVKLTGEEIPDKVYMEIEGNEYQLTKDDIVNFHYNFKNLQKNIKFILFAEDFYSKEYEIKVIPKPVILNFSVSLAYPSYTGKKNESFDNIGDITIPEGTAIKWTFFTSNTKNIFFRFKEKEVKTDNYQQNRFTYSSVFKTNQNYSIFPDNEFISRKDSLVYTISVIPDAYPIIKVVEFNDSVFQNLKYFKGMLKDDYGFKSLTFNYSRLNGEDSKKTEIQPIIIISSSTQQEFFYTFDFNSITTEPGDEYEYYFEVWDNDGVNGSKATRSQKLIYRLPSLQELENKTEKSNEQIKNELEKSLTEAKKLQKEIEEFNKKLLDKKTLSWQEKKQMQDIIDKQINLQEEINRIQKENLEKTTIENQYQKQNEEILKKQEELNKLFNELMTDEMKELLKKIQEMLNKLDKDKVAEFMDKMKLSNKELEKQLDRNLELFKQLEFEKKLSETIEKLDKLSEKQEKLSEETDKAKTNENNKLKSKQEELNKEFEDIRKNIDESQKMNQELEEPNNFDSTDAEENNIQQEQNESLENLNNNKNKKASQSQQNASEQMNELSQKLSEMQQNMEEENNAEDVNALREILENLIKASFEQENLMSQLDEIKTTDPKYVKIIQEQKKLKDDLQMIEDSLFALSKRQSQIESFVNKEISEINDNVEKAIKSLNARNVNYSVSKQQMAMTSINNLALMLSETLSAMQQQMQQSCSGKCSKPGHCKKPGNGKPSFKSIKELQEQLNKELQQLKDGMNPGGKIGQKSMSEQLAKLAAQQEAIRKQLQELMEQLKKEGQKNTGELNELQQKMEETETDIVNKIISNETIKRQQEILTRLLESEKAEKERELDEKRESTEAKNEIFSNPSKNFEYNSIKIKEVELLKTVPPSLKPFYKDKVNEYFYNFEE